jgi:sterol desaturase/sphingolipid hydroxylase (fatty acid hydroxylase superfamily)
MTFSEVYAKLIEAIKLPLSYLTDPEDRLFFPYLLSSLALAYFVYHRSKIRGSFWRYVFPKDVWLGRSAMVDYGLIFFNAAFKVFLIGPYLLFGIYLSYHVELLLPEVFGYPNVALTSTQTIILYTIVLTVALDLSIYLIHRLMHVIPIFWEFHKVHHAATTMTPFTKYRSHPVELILITVTVTLTMGVVTGIFQYLSPHPIKEATLIGANVLSLGFMVFGSNLRHSHIQLKYFKWLERVLLSPYQHQIHHSDNPEHYDRNLGSKLAIWDWMFGTLLRSDQVEDIRFGIGKDDEANYSSLWKNLSTPFVNLWHMVRRIGPKKSF